MLTQNQYSNKVSVTLENAIQGTWPDVLQLVAVGLLFAGTSSLPIFRYIEARRLADEDDDQKPLLK